MEFPFFRGVKNLKVPCVFIFRGCEIETTNHSHSIHVWYICLHLPYFTIKKEPNVGKYTIHGCYGICCFLQFNCDVFWGGFIVVHLQTNLHVYTCSKIGGSATLISMEDSTVSFPLEKRNKQTEQTPIPSGLVYLPTFWVTFDGKCIAKYTIHDICASYGNISSDRKKHSCLIPFYCTLVIGFLRGGGDFPNHS